ncbi:hypothetical protein [Streptomyces parvulus]
MASAVLDSIEARPHAFSMDNWVRLPGSTQLTPSQNPRHGSTLCAAAWAAHLTGWTLFSHPDTGDVEVLATDDEGVEYELFASVYAERGGERRTIGDVAARALGLSSRETFWLEGEGTAKRRLREIARR